MKKKYVITTLIVVSLYLAVLTGCGLFGDTAASFIRMIAPYFFATLGLAVVAFLPYRVLWAIDRNNEIKRKIEEERRMAVAAERNRKLKEAAKRYEMGDLE
jgi:hypothetical protein